MLDQGSYTPDHAKSLLSKYTHKSFVKDKTQWLTTGHLTWFIHGNLHQDDAKDLCKNGTTILRIKEASLAKLSPCGVLQFAEGTSLVYQIEAPKDRTFDS